MVLVNAVTNEQIPGDWSETDYVSVDKSCPECGADPGQQCSYEESDRPGFGAEVSQYVHTARTE